MDKYQWVERFIVKLTSQSLVDVGEALDVALEEWEPYWHEVSPDEAADVTAHSLLLRSRELLSRRRLGRRPAAA